MTYPFDYPVLLFDKYSFNVYLNEDELTQTTSAGLKSGLFTNVKLIDSTGKAWKVVRGKKVRGVGLFRGYNIFFNQKIRIELELKNTKSELSLDSIKQEVIKNLKKDRHFWESGGSFELIVSIVENQKTIKGLFKFLYELWNKESPI